MLDQLDFENIDKKEKTDIQPAIELEKQKSEQMPTQESMESAQPNKMSK